MRAKRLALASLFAALLLATVVQPVAAQSTSADLISELNNKLLYIAIPITLLVEVILIYAVLRFKDNDDPKPTKENRRLEITWTVATAIILLFVGVASYGVMADQYVTYTGTDDDLEPDNGDVIITAEAYQWGWNMYYESADGERVEVSPTELRIPTDRDVYFRVTSQDVIHGFHVPDLGLKTDAFPDQVDIVKTNAHEEGTYQGFCTEYCGVAHSQMNFQIEVVDGEEYDQWMQEQQESADNESDGSDAGSADNESDAGGEGNESDADNETDTGEETGTGNETTESGKQTESDEQSRVVAAV